MRTALTSLLLITSLIGWSQSFTLSSSTLQGQGNKKLEFKGFGCDGENVSPQLTWSNAPKETKGAKGS